MLERTKKKLESMYRNEPQPGPDGAPCTLDSITRISPEQGLFMADLHRQLQPATSVEVGMAYGFSTLFLEDAMHEHGYGHHIAIDPFEFTTWKGIGHRAVQDLGFDSRFTLMQKTSVAALTELHASGLRPEFIFIDGDHRFDGALVDFYCANKLLAVGGVAVFDDMWMPSIQKLAAFIRASFEASYEEVASPVRNVFVIQKKGDDQRPWDHSATF
ncbi:MAG TPA: class I SAM-dependent methyltransferase [Anaeromyxobacter sp.]|nr:class I SAM-dependent methyltransferase [Anaeromyxobacter sp.]